METSWHITVNHSGKMLNMQSLSSSHPPSCEKKPCYKECFDVRLVKRWSSVTKARARNTDAMINVLLPDAALPRVNAAVFRLNAGGELWNVTHARNMIRIAKHNPRTTFALWTHEPKLVQAAIKSEGKPCNLVLVYSSMNYNKPDRKPKNFDKVFTVYTKDQDVDINCGALKCFDCLKCYTVGEPTVYIKERKK